MASRELIELVTSQLPQRFYPGEHPWRMFGAAIIVRMADTVESMMVLMAARLPIDGLILLRALYEQVVRYLWVSIDPDSNMEAGAPMRGGTYASFTTTRSSSARR